MSSLNDFLRIQLVFLDRLELVEAVTAATIPSAASTSSATILKGPDQLEEFLAFVGIDSYLETSGDLFSLPPAFTVSVHKAEPKFIIEGLKRRFNEEDAIQFNIISGKRAGHSDPKARVPVSITVCAQSERSSDALQRVLTWSEKSQFHA